MVLNKKRLHVESGKAGRNPANRVKREPHDNSCQVFEGLQQNWIIM
jgi:hypothetical protein